MNNKKIPKYLLNHSKAKVKLFGDYIQKYLNIICNDKYTKAIHIYDLFCGPGVYKNGGEGSPVIALKKVKQTFYQFIDKREIKSPQIHCHFNDIDKDKINTLKTYIKENKLYYPNFGTLNFTTKDYLEVVEELPFKFQKYKNTKAFVFIDPHGYKEIKAEHILKLLDCNKNSEVLLWLPIQHMYRFSESGTPEILDNFNKQLDIDKEHLKNVWEYIDCLKNGFQKFIGNKYFVDSFTLKKEENTVFCLFFFSSHIRGYEIMLETKWNIDNENGRGWKYDYGQSTLFPVLKTNRLEQLLLDYLKESKTNGEIYEFTLRKRFLPKHSYQILKKLQYENRIEIIKEDNSKIIKGAFYVNYKGYLKHFNKLTIKVK